MPILTPKQFIEAFYAEPKLAERWVQCVWRVNRQDAIDSFYDWFVVKRMAWTLRIPFPLDREEIGVRLDMGEYRILGVCVVPTDEPGFKLALEE